jgi:hypothetical protein
MAYDQRGGGYDNSSYGKRARGDGNGYGVPPQGKRVCFPNYLKILINSMLKYLELFEEYRLLSARSVYCLE